MSQAQTPHSDSMSLIQCVFIGPCEKLKGSIEEAVWWPRYSKMEFIPRKKIKYNYLKHRPTKEKNDYSS